MKKVIQKLQIGNLLFCAVLWIMANQAFAGLNITYTGASSDGVLSPTIDSAGVVDGVLTIDLSKALTGKWDHAVTAKERAEGSSVYGRGVYDPDKWAVVYKYQSVNIPEDVTIKFKNHPSRAPVVWLIAADATVAGTVDVSGEDGVAAPALAEPGPGGFRGCVGFFHENTPGSAGFGPGGGERIWNDPGTGGSYGTLGSNGTTAYGNPSLIPLVGGSGGGSSSKTKTLEGGGAGGGAILFVSPDNFVITGSIIAKGGDGSWSRGSRSGGAIRLVTGTLSGNGKIETLGGNAKNSSPGSEGRIRIERISVDEADGVLQVVPAPSVVELDENGVPLIWPPDKSPEVTIVSVGGKPVGSDPRASFGVLGPDVSIPETTETDVVVETINVEEAAEVYVRVTNRNVHSAEVQASADTKRVVSTDPLTIHWTVPVPVKLGYSALQVRVVRP